MNTQVWIGIILPFLGTCLGAATVFVLKDRISNSVQRMLSGFAAGVMVAASFWSLLQPSLDGAAHMGRLSFIPAAVGFLLGIGFLQLMDNVTPHMHIDGQSEGSKRSLKPKAMLLMAVTLHNIPEGMAIGIIYAGWVAGDTGVSKAGALALALGVALHNFPVGAIVSMPLRTAGVPKAKAFWYGVLSGIVEPIASLITIAAASAVVPILPYLLAFAAGAMFYVVIEELIPEMSAGQHSNMGAVVFSLGFVLMMVLEVALE